MAVKGSLEGVRFSGIIILASLAAWFSFLGLPAAAWGGAVVQEWIRSYSCPPSNGYAWGYKNAIAVDGHGNIYIIGLYEEFSAIVKYNSDGRELWARPFTGQLRAIALDGQSNVYVTGNSVRPERNPKRNEYTTVKYNAEGQELWCRRYWGPGNGNDCARAIALDSQDNVYVTGYSMGSCTGYDYATIKYSPDGRQLWARRYNGPGNGDDYAGAIAVDGRDNVYVTGSSMGSGTASDYATIKYSPDGRTRCVRRYNGPGNGYDCAKAIAVDGQDNVYVTGSSYGDGTFVDYATIKYSPQGRQLWISRYSRPGDIDEEGTAMALDSQGNIYVTGISTINRYAIYKYKTIKYDPDGQELWVRSQSIGDLDNSPPAIAVDGQDNVYITGTSTLVGYDFLTVKYGPQGRKLWENYYNVPGYCSFGDSIAVDGQGNVYVTGKSTDQSEEVFFVTIKYTQTP